MIATMWLSGSGMGELPTDHPARVSPTSFAEEAPRCKRPDRWRAAVGSATGLRPPHAPENSQGSDPNRLALPAETALAPPCRKFALVRTGRPSCPLPTVERRPADA